MDVYNVCPLLVVQNQQATLYDGFLTVKSYDFHITIDIPENDVKQAIIHCEWSLSNLLKGYTNILQHRLTQSSSLASFLVELKAITEKQLDSKKHILYSSSSQKLNKSLVAEVEALGWNRLVYADACFDNIHLCTYDAANRRHVIEVALPQNYPETSPKWATSLPKPFHMNWNSKCTLADLLEQFQHQVSLYQDFWTEMDRLDAKTWILEPEKPSRAGTYRRIALGNNASVKIVIDPTHPWDQPEIFFFGPEHFVNPLKNNLHNNLEDWNNETSIKENLQTVLEMDLPSPDVTKKNDMRVDCSICYLYHLGTTTPDEACNNVSCGKPFHQECLYEWLRSLPDSRQSFNTMFGVCPYCSMAITVKVPVK